VRLVVDTNILVSALITPAGKPAAVVDLVLTGWARLLCDARILAEYREVLPRPRRNVRPEAAVALYADVEVIAERVEAAPLNVSMPDETDRPFIEVAATGQADALVTGNLRHFPADSPVPVLSPAEFLRRLK